MKPNDNVICSEIFKKRKFPSQNILIRLMHREIDINRNHLPSQVNQEFYKNIFPNLTIANVEKPPGFLRKFTPDGKYLIAFSFDQTSLEVYRYKGCSAAADILYKWKDEFVPNVNIGIPNEIRSEIFNKIFHLKYDINITSLNKQLNRECSLFTNDFQYVIVAGCGPIPEECRPCFYDIYTNNEAVVQISLENYTIYMVDYKNGGVSDSIDFNYDKIALSHSQSLYLYKNTFAVFSAFNQTIYTYEILNGKFVSVHEIGRFCCDFDRKLYHDIYPSAMYRPCRETTINSLKHRILAFLYKSAHDITDPQQRRHAVREFFQNFDIYKNLRMWKMQLLDENHLFIKYASEDVLTGRVTDPVTQPSYFVFYSIPDSKVINIFPHTSVELLELFENYCDMFRNSQIQSDIQYPCSTSNNIYARLLHQKCKQTIINARAGGLTEATKRLLCQLPVNAQSYSASPYLDLGLFSYDDRWISVLERPKSCGEYPIFFFGRDTGLLKFRIYPGLQESVSNNNNVGNNGRILVAFTFHPTEPFAISIQRARIGYIVNFHIRNEGTKIK